MSNAPANITGGRYHTVNGQKVAMPVQDTHEHCEVHGAQLPSKSSPELETQPVVKAAPKGKAHKHAE